MWTFWLIVSGLFFVLEIFTTGFLVFWLGIAGIIAMLVSLITTNLVIQTIVFVITSTLLMIFTRPIVNKFLKIDKTEGIPTNVYSVIGKTGIVVEDIESCDIPGKVKISGDFWTAISDTKIYKGTRIKVIEVDGVKLKVEPIRETTLV